MIQLTICAVIIVAYSDSIFADTLWTTVVDLPDGTGLVEDVLVKASC